MTKSEATEIKKIIKAECGNYTVYFNSKKGELRYTVMEWTEGQKLDAGTVEEFEKRNVLKILNALTKYGKRPPYKKDFRRYQGFINCKYLIFT